MENKFQMVAKTFQGLEEVLRDELIDLGAENVELGRRMVTFEGDNEILYKANLCCRTALRILKPIVKFTADSTDELYDKVRDLDWEQFMTPQSTFAIDSTVNGEDFNHSKFVTYRVKDAIADHFSDKYGERPSIRLSGADLIFNVHITDNRVTISLDSSGEPLYKRGYRVAQTEAPINEVLAAGIIMKTGWRGDSDFIDPMCGSGTFLIEAALIAANINPGIYRESFAFEKWADFDRDLFEDIYNDDSEERDFAYKIYGGDIDPDAVAIALKNVKSAKVEDMVEITCQSFSQWDDVAPEGIIVSNPPYGERLSFDQLNQLYRNLGSVLKNKFRGWHAWIIGYKDEHFAEIGLKPSVKIPLNNGGLDCTLLEYVMFDGKYSEFRAEGGSVANESIRKEQSQGPKKVRHISDDDWDKEAKKFNKSKGFGEEKKKKKNFDRNDSKNESMSSSKGRSFDNDDDDDFSSFTPFREEDRKPFRNDGNRKPFRQEDRKPFRNDGDRKPFRQDDRKPFRNDGDRKPFRQDDRKPFRNDGDRKPFRQDDRKPFRNDCDRKPFRNDGDRKPFRNEGESKPFRNDNEKSRFFERGNGINYDPSKARSPRISRDSEVVVNPVHMRSRKPKKEEGNED